jgi:hypothetical protein
MGFERLRAEIDDIDAELVRLILRRAALSDRRGPESLGGTKIVYNREVAVLERFRELGHAWCLRCPGGAWFSIRSDAPAIGDRQAMGGSSHQVAATSRC